MSLSAASSAAPKTSIPVAWSSPMVASTPENSKASLISPKKCSNFLAIFNLVNTCIGLGIIKLPRALMDAGWFGGLVMLVGSYAVCTYAMILFYKALTNNATGKTLTSFEDLGVATFGRIGQGLFFFVMYGTMTVFLIVILNLLGDAIHTLLPASIGFSPRVWVVVASVIVLPLSWLPTMREVGIVSAMALISVAMVVVVTVTACVDHAVSTDADIEYNLISASFVDFTGAFTVFLLAYCCTNTAPTIIRDMERPQDFPKVAVIAFAVIVSIYGSISVVGYWSFGNSLANYDTVIKAISPDADNPSLYAYFLQAGVVVMVTTHYMICFAPCGSFIDRMLNLKEASTIPQKACRTVGRSALVAVTALCAVLVPGGKVGPLLDVMAAVNCTSMAVLIPVAVYWRTLRQIGAPRRATGRVVAEVGILCVGVFGAVVGTISAVRGIMEEW